MAALGTGFGKLILFGEHAAVFGHAAIGVRLPERTAVTIQGSETEAWDLRLVAEPDQPVVRKLLGKLETLLPELAHRGRGEITIQSNVPRAVGLGSSAAVCSAMAEAALRCVTDADASPGSPSPATTPGLTATWELAHELERIFHGTPSGIDTGLSLLDGLSAFSPRPPALPAWEPLSSAELWLCFGALPRAGGSAELIRGIGDRMRAGEPAVRDALSRLGAIASEARQSLASGCAASVIGRLADGAMDVLRGLGLSSPSLDWILEEGMRWGALGGKLSGAGGGGAFFLAARDGKACEQIARQVEKAARGQGIELVAPPRALFIGPRTR
ncbi:MAG: hypothetical protein ABSG17_00255 [Spirochaetia bacterium]|jgi:mevalonate kinase